METMPLPKSAPESPLPGTPAFMAFCRAHWFCPGISEDSQAPASRMPGSHRNTWTAVTMGAWPRQQVRESSWNPEPCPWRTSTSDLAAATEHWDPGKRVAKAKIQRWLSCLITSGEPAENHPVWNKSWRCRRIIRQHYLQAAAFLAPVALCM